MEYCAVNKLNDLRMHYNALSETSAYVERDYLKSNEEYFETYLREKYTSWSYNPEKSLFENVKDTLESYVKGETYLDNALLGELAGIYALYKSGVMNTEDAKTLYEYIKPIYIKYDSYYALNPNLNAIAHYSWIEGEEGVAFGKVFVNETVFDYLTPSQKLEVLLHESIHAFQSLYNKDILKSEALSEGEAVVYSEMWVRELDPSYTTLVNDTYKRYKDMYISTLMDYDNFTGTIEKIRKLNGLYKYEEWEQKSKEEKVVV